MQTNQTKNTDAPAANAAHPYDQLARDLFYAYCAHVRGVRPETIERYERRLNPRFPERMPPFWYELAATLDGEFRNHIARQIQPPAPARIQ